MRLRFLRVNQAWGFFLGDTLTDMRGEWLFNAREDAVAAARDAGLSVDKTGLVS